MDSSKRKRTVRQATPTGEALEGRQLLSVTTPTTTDAGTAPPPVEAMTTTAMTTSRSPHIHHWRSFHGSSPRGHLGGLGMTGRPHGPMTGGPTSTPVNPAMQQVDPSSATDPADPSAVAPRPWAGMKGGMGSWGHHGRLGHGPMGMTPTSGRAGDSNPNGPMPAPGGSTTNPPTPGTGTPAMGGPWKGTGMGMAPTPAQAQAFDALAADLRAIHSKSTVTPALEAALRSDFEAIRKAATSAPDATKVDALQADLKDVAAAGALPTDAQKAKVEADFTAVLNSEGVTDSALIGKTIADAEAILAASNLTNDDLARLAADRQAAGLGTQYGAPLPGLDGLAFGATAARVHRGTPMPVDAKTPADPVDQPDPTGTSTPAATTDATPKA